MWRDAAMLRREAKGKRYIEVLDRAHLPVEPRVRVRTKAVRPAQTGAQMPHAELAQPADRVVEPMIFEMKPLADAERGRVVGELLRRRLRRAVLPQQSQVKMPVV